MPNDAEFDVRKQYNDVESDHMTYEAPLDREICLMGVYCISVPLSNKWLAKL
jgi:hypothetical protein